MITFIEDKPREAGLLGPPGALGDVAAKFKLREAPLFYLIVVFPTLLAAIYFFLIASPVYVSNASFFVRSATVTQATGLNSVLQTVGLGQAETDSFAVHEYIMSRDAIGNLVQYHDLRGVLDRPGADFITRFPRLFQRGRLEDLFRAYPRFVDVSYNSTTGISTLRVKAFRPQDAQNIALALLNGGEGVINRLNTQAQNDAVAEAMQEVQEAEVRVALAQHNLTAFRNHEQLIDPAQASVMSNALIGKLSTDLATLRAQRSALAASAPQSPQLPLLDRQIDGYSNEIAAEQLRIAGETGSLAPKIATYEQLTLDREFADRALASATTSLETARIDARRKRLYLERVVKPSIPDASTEPKRAKDVALVLITTLLAYGTTLLVIAGFREHRQI